MSFMRITQRGLAENNMAELKKVNSEDGTEQSQVIVLKDGTEITLDEIDNGYMRQSDYSRKTQALAEEKRALETANVNHQVNQSLETQPDANKANTDTTKMYLDMKMERLKDVHGESFDEVAVLKKAAQMLNSGVSPTDIDFDFIARGLQKNDTDTNALKEAMRKEIMAEMQQKGIDTSSIISSGDPGQVIEDGTYGLNPSELEFCRKSGEDPKTYAKWKSKRNR